MKKTFLEFLTSKELTQEKFDAMTANEKAGLYNEYNAELKAYIEKLEENVDGKATKEEVEKLVAEAVADLNKSNVEQLDTLNKALIEVGLAIKAQGEIAKGDISLTTEKSLDNELKANEAALKAMAETGEGKVTLKVVGDMTIIGNISGGNIPVEQREAGVNNIARRNPFIRQLVNNGIATSNVISWVEQTGVEGAPGGTVEGTLKNQIDFDLVVVNESVKKRTAFIKVSTEMLGDIDFMRSEINNELSIRLALDIDDQILNGDDAGQNLNGIIPQSTAWAAGAFALTVDLANLVDVLTVSANQVFVANHQANVHVVHPTDLTALRLIKAGAADGQYVNRLQDVAGNLTLDGIPVVQNTGITQDNFLTMDGTKDTVFSRGEATIMVGLDSDDFTKNMRTVLIEWRGLNRIKGNDLTAFVTGVISTSAAALETV